MGPVASVVVLATLDGSCGSLPAEAVQTCRISSQPGLNAHSPIRERAIRASARSVRSVACPEGRNASPAHESIAFRPVPSQRRAALRVFASSRLLVQEVRTA